MNYYVSYTFVCKFQTKPLLLGHLYNRDRQNTFDNVFASLVQSRAVLEFGIGCQMVINYYIVPENIRNAYREVWER